MKGEGGPKEALEARIREGKLSLAANAIVGFSGGPDSTALLAALVALGATRLRALHVDHGLRPVAERAEELAVARRLCTRLALPLTVARVRPGAIEERAARLGEGIEAAARFYRYAAFSRIARREGADVVYLAHTRDDQLETILMRLFTGSGAAGLRGMPMRSGIVMRPFLDIGKAAILSWLHEEGFPWSTDSTNASAVYTRNRVRAVLVPALDAALPGWKTGLLRSAVKAGQDEEALAELSRASGFVPSGEGRLVAPASLLSEAVAIRQRVFLAAAGSLLGGATASSRLGEAAFAALEGGSKSYRGGGLVLERSDRGIELSSSLDFPVAAGYFIRIDDPGPKGLRVRIGNLRFSAFWQRGNAVEGIRGKAFSFPLIVRSRRPGDALPIRGGRKLLDVLFSEWGIARADRDRIPVLEDGEGIVGVLAAAWGGRDRYRHSETSEGDIRFSIKVKGA